MKRSNSSIQKGRIVAFLSREEIDFIDKLSKDALFSTGHKLTRTDIVQALVDAARACDINGEGIHSKPELERKLLALMNVTLPQAFYNLKKGRNSNESH
jgi:hypothetical protein